VTVGIQGALRNAGRYDNASSKRSMSCTSLKTDGDSLM
jgi:hypothetical protein